MYMCIYIYIYIYIHMIRHGRPSLSWTIITFTATTWNISTSTATMLCIFLRRLMDNTSMP